MIDMKESKRKGFNEFLKKYGGVIFLVSCLTLCATLIGILIVTWKLPKTNKEPVIEKDEVAEQETIPVAKELKIEELEITSLDVLDYTKPRLTAQIYLNSLTDYEKKRLKLTKENLEQKWLSCFSDEQSIVCGGVKIAKKDNKTIVITSEGKQLTLQGPKIWKNGNKFILLGIARNNYEENIHIRDLVWVEISSEANTTYLQNLGNVDLVTYSKKYKDKKVTKDASWILSTSGNRVSCIVKGEEVAYAEALSQKEKFDKLSEFMLSNKGVLYSLRNFKINQQQVLTLLPEDTEVKRVMFEFSAVMPNGEKYKIPVYKKDGKNYILLPELDNVQYLNFSFKYRNREIKPCKVVEYVPEEMISSIYFVPDEDELRACWILDYNGYQAKKVLKPQNDLRCYYLSKLIPKEELPKEMWDSLSYREYKQIINTLQKRIDKLVQKEPKKVKRFLKKEAKKRTLSKDEKDVLEQIKDKEKQQKAQPKSSKKENKSDKNSKQKKNKNGKKVKN